MGSQSFPFPCTSLVANKLGIYYASNITEVGYRFYKRSVKRATFFGPQCIVIFVTSAKEVFACVCLLIGLSVCKQDY